jgi:hypothetical protein
MRKPYQPPTLIVAGSVHDITQANAIGPQPDNLTVVTTTIGGVTVNIPGQGAFS